MISKGGGGERIKSAHVALEQLKAFLKGFKRSLTEVAYRLANNHLLLKQSLQYLGKSHVISYLFI